MFFEFNFFFCGNSGSLRAICQRECKLLVNSYIQVSQLESFLSTKLGKGINIMQLKKGGVVQFET